MRDGGGPQVDRRLPLIVGLAGAALTLAAARFRAPGLGNDATSYVAIADHVAAGRGLGYFLEPKLALWPPGWPVLLAIPKWLLDVPPQATALVVNMATCIPIALLSHALLRRMVADRRLVAVGTIVAVLGPATMSQTYMVQTEPTFIALTLATWWCLIRFSDTHQRKFLWWAAALMWLAFLDRYVGIVAIGAGALWLCFDRGWAKASERLRNAVTFGMAASVVPAAWLIRNIVVTGSVGSAFGPRDTPVATYTRNTIDAVTSVGQYLHGYSEYEPFTGLARLLTLALLAAVGLLAIVLLRRALAARAAAPDARSRPPVSVFDVVGHPAGLLTIYAAAHWAYMIYSASTIAFDPVNTRYLVPMFIPAMIAGFVLVDRGAFALVRPTGAGADGVTRLCSAALAVFLVVQVGLGLVRVSASYWTDKAQRYNSEVARDILRSPVFDRIPDDCRLLSNFPEFTYLAGIEAQRSPRITKFASSDRQTDLAEVRRAVDRGARYCLVWVSDARTSIFLHPSYQHPFSELARTFDLERVAADRDVAVYRLRPGADG